MLVIKYNCWNQSKRNILEKEYDPHFEQEEKYANLLDLRFNEHHLSSDAKVTKNQLQNEYDIMFLQSEMYLSMRE